jgi:hypothetical protein
LFAGHYRGQQQKLVISIRVIQKISPSTSGNGTMNQSTSFDPPNVSNASPSLPFDYLTSNVITQTIYTHLSNLSDHIQLLSEIQPVSHALSSFRPPLWDNTTSDVLTVSAALQTYHSTMIQLVEPINSDPVLLGAERFVSRLKEHSALISRLETRKKAIRQVKEELSKIQVKRSGLRHDLRFSEGRITSLVKELG